MKKIVSLIIVILTSSYLEASSIRAPQMPRGLTADKTEKNTKLAGIKKKNAQKKVKRKGLQGYEKRLSFSEMNVNELMAAKDQKLKEKNWDIAAKYLERMIKIADDINQKAATIIELADLLFFQEKYDDAAKWFAEFTQLYPGNEKIEYASYKAIECATKQILSVDRDQSATEKALSLANDFLKRDAFTHYAKEVTAIAQLCEKTLAQSDCYVAEFYLKHKSFAAAERRITNLRSDWIEKVPEIKAPVIGLEIALAQEYPAFKAPQESIVLAQATMPVKKVDMANRF